MKTLSFKTFLWCTLIAAIFSASGFSSAMDFERIRNEGGIAPVMHFPHEEMHADVDQIAPPAHAVPAPRRSWTCTQRTIVAAVSTTAVLVGILYLLNPLSTRSIATKNSSFEVDVDNRTNSPLPAVWYDSRFFSTCPVGEKDSSNDTNTTSGFHAYQPTCQNLWAFSKNITQAATKEAPQLAMAWYNGSSLPCPVRNILSTNFGGDGAIGFSAIVPNGTISPIIVLQTNDLFATCPAITMQISSTTTIKPINAADLTLPNVIPAPKKKLAPGNNYFGGVALISAIGMTCFLVDLKIRYKNAVIYVNSINNSSWRLWGPTAGVHTWFFGNPEVWQEVRNSYGI